MKQTLEKDLVLDKDTIKDTLWEKIVKGCQKYTKLSAFFILFATRFVSAQEAQPDNSNSSSTWLNQLTAAAPAGFFLEPSLIGNNENFSMRSYTAQPSDTSGTANGYGLGLRLGAHASQIVFLGLDARYTRTQLSDSFYQNAGADVYNVGPTIGVQMPYFGARLLGTYVMAGEFSPSPGVGGFDVRFQNPRGWRGGLGVHIASVGVNLEYEDLTYQNSVVESAGSVTANTSVNTQARTNGYLLSLSFPIEL